MNIYYLFIGVKVLFKVAIVLLRHTLGTTAALRKCDDDLYATLQCLRQCRIDTTKEQQFIDEVSLCVCVAISLTRNCCIFKLFIYN
jgi:hypothetical protein